MNKHSHSPRPWKYEWATSQTSTRSRMINNTDFDGPNGCWNWVGAKNEQGYGTMGLLRDGVQRYLLVHRLALHVAGRPVPADKTVDHLCRNRSCVNPAHLEAVDDSVNILRGEGFFAVNARKTHCVNGHEFTEANIRWVTARTTGRQSRSCRACADKHYQAVKAKRLAAKTSLPR